MTKRKRSLSEAVGAFDRSTKASATTAMSPSTPQHIREHNTTAQVAPSRVGKKAIGGHFDPAVSKQLRALALEYDTSVQALLTEALNDLFEKYGKSRLAE